MFLGEDYREYEITTEGFLTKKTIEMKIVKRVENFVKSGWCKDKDNIKVTVFKEKISDDGVTYNLVGIKVHADVNASFQADSDDYNKPVNYNELKRLAKASSILSKYI